MTSLSRREEDAVRERIASYLSRDRDGRRRAVLSMFCRGELFCTSDIDSRLRGMGFDVKDKGTPAMVGLMSSKTGVLHVDITGNHNFYSIKEKYRELVVSMVSEHRR